MPPITVGRGIVGKIHKEMVAVPPQPPPKAPFSKAVIAMAIGGGLLFLGIVVAVTVHLAGSPESAPQSQQTIIPPATPANAAPVARPPAATTTAPVAKPPTPPVSRPATPPPAVAHPATPTPTMPATTRTSPYPGQVSLGSPHGLLCEYFDNPGTQMMMADFRKLPTFPNKPTERFQLDRFELPKDRGNGYGARLRGFLVPEVSGTYEFQLAVNYVGEVVLGTSEAPASAKPLISGNYRKMGTKTTTLTAGQRYYVEAMFIDGKGSDYLTLTWTVPGSTAPVVIGGRNLEPWRLTP